MFIVTDVIRLFTCGAVSILAVYGWCLASLFVLFLQFYADCLAYINFLLYLCIRKGFEIGTAL